MPLLYAIFLWWFTTGMIVALSRSSQAMRRVGFLIGSLMMVPTLFALALGARNPAPLSVYVTFTCGVLIWGWLLAGYYFDVVTGPPVRATATESTQDLQTRFRLALQGSLYHELLTVAVALVLIALTWGQPNRWGLWIFLALWLMHTSAKLSIFLGVRNFRIDFLPLHLRYAEDLLGESQSNRLLPISVCCAVSVALALLYQAIRPVGEAGHAVGSLLVATMLILGIIEHVMLVLPLPVALFGWGLRPLADPAADQATTHGTSRTKSADASSLTGHRQAVPLGAYVDQHGEQSQA